VWGECTGGSVEERIVPGPSGPGSSTQALSEAGACVNNPCDPYCSTYNENPEGGVSSDATAPIFQWQGGNILGFPAGLVKKGLKEPCASGADCQFNTYCEHPRTAPPCSHSKCMTGGGLDPTCDECVSEICQVAPTCCTPAFSGTCWHSPCVQGSKLKASCDPCVAAICAANPNCCDNKWDSACVNAVATKCAPKTCSPGNWQQSCVDKVATVCDAVCGAPKPSTCAHSVCTTGAKLAVSCNLCVAQICAVDPYCCSTSWDNICVGEVATECGLSCPVNMQSPPPEEGQCKEWMPGQKDPSCAGIDLAVDVPCDGTIPVCNHGNTTAPANIKIIHFPANSGQYPLCNPDQSHPQMKTCFTTQPIPPGQCISVTGCAADLVGNREIMVNPPGPGQVAECSCKDNWSLYSSGTCIPPVCAGATTEGAVKKVNMLITLDRSGSMAGTKWSATTTALKSFFQAPSSAGLNVAFEAWATSPGTLGGIAHDGCGQTTCNSTPCSNPIVPAGTLLATSAPADVQEQKLVNVISALTPSGGTPTYPAVEGGLLWAQAGVTANPNDVYVLILVTDGEPTTCTVWPDTNVAVQGLASAAYLGYGIRTYTIGMEGADIAALNAIAAAGGSGSAFVIVGNNISGVAQQLIDALNAIASENVSCNLNLPALGTFDPQDVTVTLLPSAGAPVGLPKVANLAACGTGVSAGWYFDNAATPTKILLCPGSCTAAQTDPGSKIQFNVGCPKQFKQGVYTQIYEAQCPPGTKPQWGFFAYDSVTPSDSNVVFEARTAVTSADLPTATFKTLATAKAVPNTQTCPLTGPSPCPIDLYNIFGLPGAKFPWLELKITVNPSTGGGSIPTVNSWNVTYSCPPGE
jgi:hypothetical protein